MNQDYEFVASSINDFAMEQTREMSRSEYRKTLLEAISLLQQAVDGVEEDMELER